MWDSTGETLRSRRNLLSYPPALRRGLQNLIKPPNPAAGGGFTYRIPGDYWTRPVSVSFTVATSATAATRSLALNMLDGDGYNFNATGITSTLGPSQTQAASGDLFPPTEIQLPASFQNEGAQTGPVALTTIATVTLPSGGYTVAWTVSLGGTTAAAEENNFGLYNGSTLVVQSVNGDTAQQNYPQNPVSIQVPVGGATYNIKNIAAGTSTAIYAAQLVVTSDQIPTLQYQFPDIVLAPGWQIQIALGNAQAGDQISGIGMLLEQYASNYANGGVALEDEAEVINYLRSQLARY